MMNMKKLFFGAVLSLFCHEVAQAQILPLGPYGTSPITFGVDTNGVLDSSGTENGTAVLSSAEQGAGTRLLWYPGKAAFRAGYVNGTQWNDANIGTYSIALGYDSQASGFASVAMESGTASGSYSVALGFLTYASNFGSIAVGGAATSTGNSSVALGESSATGDSAISMGWYTSASGLGATAVGGKTQAAAYLSFAAGYLNVGGGNPNTWVATDPLFEIGNGTTTPNIPFTPIPSDALVIYKNGNAVFSPPPGTASCSVSAPVFVTTTPGGSGDIPMYTGN